MSGHTTEGMSVPVPLHEDVCREIEALKQDLTLLVNEIEQLRQLADDLIEAGKRANYAALHDLAERARELRP